MATSSSGLVVAAMGVGRVAAGGTLVLTWVLRLLEGKPTSGVAVPLFGLESSRDGRLDDDMEVEEERRRRREEEEK